MKHHRHIIEAIDLLMADHEKQRLPWWVKPLDYILTAVYLTAYAYALYSLITWL